MHDLTNIHHAFIAKGLGYFIIFSCIVIMPKNSNINNMRLEETHNLIEKIRALPLHLKSDSNQEISDFLEQMIDSGSKLDYLFTSWDTTNPIWEIQEDLLSAYGLLKLHCIETLVKSSFGKKHLLRSKYHALIEDDGMTDIILPLIHPDLAGGRLQLDNKPIRFGVTYGDEKIVRPSPEGIQQFKSAHESLKKKIEALSLILRNEFNNENNIEKKVDKVIIKINKDKKEISKDVSGKTLLCPFRGKVNKRFGYIVTLAKNNKKVGASELSTKSYQSISGEVDAINKRITRDLDLTQNIIKNDGNSGYEIDRTLYEPIFI